MEDAEIEEEDDDDAWDEMEDQTEGHGQNNIDPDELFID